MTSKAFGLAQLGNAYSDGALSNRNKIINGAMQVWQRGTSFAYNSFGGANFCVDRFWFYNGGGATSGTIEQSTDVPSGEGFAYSLFNNTNAELPSGTNVELTKQGNAAPFVVGNTYTLSFWVKGSSASSGLTLPITWRNAHASGTNTTQAVAANPTFNVTTSWARVVIPFTLSVSPASTNNVLDFEYAHPAGAKITGVQLEAGDTATPFEHRSYGQELALCMRYFQALGGVTYTRFFSGFVPAAGEAVFSFVFPVQMRAAPTASASGTTAVYHGAYVVSTTTSVGFSDATTSSIACSGFSSGLTTNGGALLLSNNDASARITFSAEL